MVFWFELRPISACYKAWTFHQITIPILLFSVASILQVIPWSIPTLHYQLQTCLNHFVLLSQHSDLLDMIALSSPQSVCLYHCHQNLWTKTVIWVGTECGYWLLIFYWRLVLRILPKGCDCRRLLRIFLFFDHTTCLCLCVLAVLQPWFIILLNRYQTVKAYFGQFLFFFRTILYSN